MDFLLKSIQVLSNINGFPFKIFPKSLQIAARFWWFQMDYLLELQIPTISKRIRKGLYPFQNKLYWFRKGILWKSVQFLLKSDKFTKNLLISKGCPFGASRFQRFQKDLLGAARLYNSFAIWIVSKEFLWVQKDFLLELPDSNDFKSISFKNYQIPLLSNGVPFGAARFALGGISL